MSPSKAERTKRRILEAAAELFGAKSFDGVSMRAIARAADVDPALIHHYFGSKDDLFEAVLAHGASPDDLVADVTRRPPEEWGEELVRRALALMDSPAGPALRALLRSGIASHPELLRTVITRQVVTRIVDRLDGPLEGRRKRAVLVGSQFVGLYVARYLVRIEPLASMPADEVVRLVGPTIQRYLTGDLPLVEGSGT